MRRGFFAGEVGSGGCEACEPGTFSRWAAWSGSRETRAKPVGVFGGVDSGDFNKGCWDPVML